MRKDGKSARNGRADGGGGLLPNSMRMISSCLKTVSSNCNSVASAVRSVGASVSVREEEKEQVQWIGFDLLDLGPAAKRVLLLAYTSGFQVLDVEDASNVHELVSKRDGPVTFLQMQPRPSDVEGEGGFRALQPLLLVVAGDENSGSGLAQGGISVGNVCDLNASNSTVVRFYSLRSHNYVHVLRFRSTVYLVRCSPQIIAVALAGQIYCFDVITLENKFNVPTYPLPLLGQAVTGVNVGYGPMSVGSRWLSYASNESLVSTSGRPSPQNLTPSSGVSPSTSPGNGSLMTHFAVESGKHLAAGLINLGDIGYKTLSRYCQEILPDGSVLSLSSNEGPKLGRLTSSAHSSEKDNAGVVAVKDFVANVIIAYFRAHASPISALCFDTSGTLLVTASVHGNNINVFRIMPSRVNGDQDPPCYDWSASHVHLYKLYRGMTSAVIQDICFNNYSQWIAITSSRGTCHIFTLSPFGGEVALPSHAYSADGSSSNPLLPWWSTSGPFTLGAYQSLQPPPPPVTLAVVCRIKNNNGGWLNTVNSPLVTTTAKKTAPSGVISAVFHNSVHRMPLLGCSKLGHLEHLLVYSPSGYVMQHNLLPSPFMEPNHLSKSGTSSVGLNEDEGFKVFAEPVQWWDVCRRISWPERDGNISSAVFDKTGSKRNNGRFPDCNDISSLSLRTLSNGVHPKDHKTDVDCHLYLSNAEVQINSGKLPICQTSKICFYVMMPAMINGTRECYDYYGGELEIEKIPVQENSVKEQHLHPVVDPFHRFQSDESFGCAQERYVRTLSLDLCEAKMLPGAPIKDSYSKELAATMISGISSHSPREMPHFHVTSVNSANGHSECSVSSAMSPRCSSLELPLESRHAKANDAVDIRQFLQEGYCKVLDDDDDDDDCEAAADADDRSISIIKEKRYAGDCDDTSGVFAFSEEG